MENFGDNIFSNSCFRERFHGLGWTGYVHIPLLPSKSATATDAANTTQNTYTKAHIFSGDKAQSPSQTSPLVQRLGIRPKRHVNTTALFLVISGGRKRYLVGMQQVSVLRMAFARRRC